jgi:hypothetical protein
VGVEKSNIIDSQPLVKEGIAETAEKSYLPHLKNL